MRPRSQTRESGASPSRRAAFAPFVLQKDDKPFAKLEIWDTAGQEQFESLAPMYYRGAEGALLVFDLGSEESFESMKHWSEELGNNGQDGVCMVVCGNKLDMVTADDSLRVVESVDAQRFADSIGAEYFETSARTGTNVTTAFSRLTEEIMAKRRAQAGEAMPSFEELRGRHDSVALGGSGSDGSGGKPGSRKCC